MEIDPSQLEALRQKSDTLRALSTGSIPSSISKLSSSSRALPSEKDFHYYYNFDEFRAPIDEIGAKSHSMLQKIGSSRHLFSGKEMSFPQGDVDDDDACDWLVNVNDDVIERFDYSIDEFSRLRKEEEGAKVTVGGLVDQNGFQLVLGKKKRLVIPPGAVVGMREKEDSTTPVVVKVAERDKKTVGPKPKIPFHIPTIKRPQEEFNILVNNANQPFQHVWLERSEDGSRFIHPLEKLSAVDFADQTSLEPVEPLPYESTPFKVVEEVKDLKDLAAKLRSANEFAVDLEHNQYRSFQGLTCLMQISTRTEDFVVDTLKLRIHIGPYLREVFKDHTKKKVMHGADRDIAWLQRDFGIYVCNLFDTGQASRVLQMERHSLEYLLQHFCGVTANKEYQNADWRLRPLPEEMIRYAREDTHYLLYIYDLMRIRLSETLNSEYPDGLLLEVYKRSYDLCMQLYEKELLTDTSYLYIYGVQGANLNAQQLSIVAGLSEWRDMIARAEDESTGYILPNKTLLEIAKQMPLTTSKLRRLVKSKHTYVERNLSAVVTIIRHAVQNASSFEAVAEQLKDGRIQAPESSSAGIDFPEVYTAGEQSGEGFDGDQNEHVSDPLPSNEGTCEFTKFRDGVSFGEFSRNANMGRNTKESLASSSQKGDINVEATVQVLRKPNRAFGALLGSSSSRKKPDFIKDKGDNKLEQIKSSVNLPFFSFLQRNQQSNLPSKQTPQESNRVLDTQLSAECSAEPATSLDSEDIILLDGDRQSNQAPEEPVPEIQPSSSSKLDDIILLDSDSDDEAPQADESAGTENQANTKDNQETSTPELVVLDEDDDVEEDENDNGEPMSLSDLSSNFQKCLQSSNENEAAKQDCNSKQTGLLQFKPFDYEAARKELRFGENAGRGARTGDNSGGGKNMGKKKGDKSKQEEAGLPQGRRRQAFPASGNRSATFR